MKITMQYIGAENEQGARFVWATRCDVETDDEAHLAGQKFARLCDRMGDGAMDWQGAAWATDEQDG